MTPDDGENRSIRTSVALAGGPVWQRLASRCTGRAPAESYAFVAVAVVMCVLHTSVYADAFAASQIVVMSMFVAVLGLPHGALDPLLAYRVGLWHRPLSLVLFLAGYLALSVLVVGAWLLAPVASLVGFLVISAAHFGSDWNAEQPVVIRVLTGVALLSLPAFRDTPEVARLFALISGPRAATVASLMAAAGPLLMIGFAISAAIAASARWYEGVELVVAATLALTTPPLVFFTVYFCLLHSARHLREGLAAEGQALRRPASWALLGGAIVVPIMIAVALLSRDTTDTLDARLVRIVFIGLAALTVPHMVVMAISAHQRQARIS